MLEKFATGWNRIETSGANGDVMAVRATLYPSHTVSIRGTMLHSPTVLNLHAGLFPLVVFALCQARMRAVDSKGALLTGYAPVTQHAHVRDLLEGAEIVALMRGVLGEAPATLSQKWVCRFILTQAIISLPIRVVIAYF